VDSRTSLARPAPKGVAALSKQEKARLLSGVDLFSALGPRALGSIAAMATEVEFPAGRYIARQGEVGSGVFVIARGSARVVRGDEQLTVFGPGDFFGELSVMDRAPRVASVVAIEPTLCLAIAAWDFLDLLERNPKLMKAVLLEVVSRLRVTTEHIRH
jgi:CRP/FNR family cyclic AMP-dependent transcriptional regulator